MSKPPSDIPPPASSSPDVFSDAVSPGRRDFLKLTAAAGATLLGGCLNDDDPPQELGATAASIAKFDHMVVVMFENRSFDGLLGYCYQATDPPPRNQTFNGLAGKEYRNPVPAYINDGNADVATRISPGTEADMQNPNPIRARSISMSTPRCSASSTRSPTSFSMRARCCPRTTHPRPERRRRCRASSGTIATTSSRSTSATRRSKNIG